MGRRSWLRALAFVAAIGAGGTCIDAFFQPARAAAEAQLRFSTIRWKDHHATAQDRAGQSHELGLDEDLQKSTKRLLVRAQPIAGAATLIDATSGQVLSAVEIGQARDARGRSGSLLFDPIAPAASVFKLVTTIALYEKTDVTPYTRVCTSGGLRGIEREHLTPAKGPGALCTKFNYALGVSRNAAYAQLATQKLMRGELQAVAESLGFERRVRLDVPARVGHLELPYNDLAFARAAAGFENSHLSVFGAAQLASIIAHGGRLQPLHFQRLEEDEVELGPRVIQHRTASRLKNSMEVTVHSGTARSSFVDERGRSTVGPVQVAGKTGTLQEKAGGPTTSWFVGFAPSDRPRVIVSVVLQNPPKWHQRGHEVARDLLREYLSGIGVHVP